MGFFFILLFLNDESVKHIKKEDIVITNGKITGIKGIGGADTVTPFNSGKLNGKSIAVTTYLYVNGSDHSNGTMFYGTAYIKIDNDGNPTVILDSEGRGGQVVGGANGGVGVCWINNARIV